MRSNLKREATIKDGIRAFPAFPVVLVSTRENILTVGLIHRFSYNPFMLGIGIAYQRYSYQLIKEEKEFAVNIPTASQLEQVILCGKLSGRDVDKFEITEFTKTPGKHISSSMIAECPVSIECKVVQELKLQERAWFIGDVVSVQAEENFDPSEFLLCNRKSYLLVSKNIGSR